MDENFIRASDDGYIEKTVLRTDANGDIYYKVVDRTTREIYCLKVFSHSFEPSEREEIQREFQILKDLDHPNLVKCYGVREMADGKIHLLLEYLDREYEQATDDLSIKKDESQLADVAHQLLLGLDYLHQKQIWHGDIKTSNIFLNSSNQLKLLYVGKTLSRTPIISDGLGVDVVANFCWDIWNLGLSILKFYMGSGSNLKSDVLFQQPSVKRHQIAHVKSTDHPHSSEIKKPVHYTPFADLVQKKYASFTDLVQKELADLVQKKSTHEAFVDLPVPVLKSSKDLWNFLRCCMQTDVSRRWNTTRLLRHPFICYPSASSRQKRSHSSHTTSTNIIQWSVTDLSSEDSEKYIPNKRPKLSLEYEKSIHHTEDLKIGTDSLDAYDKCIRHCSLFPQDFEFDMDKVVQLWVAEECINEEERMEDLFKSYFEYLVNEEFIIPKRLDIMYGKMMFKLNISKFSQWSEKNGTNGDYFRAHEGNMDEILRATTARHLSFHCKTFDPKTFDALKDFKQLHTLLLLGDSGCRINLLPNALFLGLKLLRSLDLSFASISELPSSIGNLESLRCLDVSETPIRQLPESTDRLRFLQTVRLRNCVGIRSLPKKFEKLINLRHLDLDIVRQLKSMPKGMGSLTKLQTLHAFLVGKNNGCGIQELENLNNITGSFCISGLEYVSSLDEAKQAMLGNKKHLDMLELRWSDHINENSLMDDEILLECLQPYFGIKELKILCYNGSKLPCWISNPSFTNLANITLYKCVNCHILPSIGELPSLRSLTIVEMNSLRDINSIFCRNHGTLGSGAFPSLEKLTLDNMLNLEKWTGLEDGDFLCLGHIVIKYCPKLSILPVLSHLRSLLFFEISHCSQLISLPEGGMPSSLESLIVRGCPNINEGCIKDGQDRCKIAHVTNIWIDFKKISLN